MEEIMQFIIVQIGTESFGVDLFTIKEVIGRLDPLSIQRKNSSDTSCLLGMLHNKNDYLPVIDLHSKFQISESSNRKIAIVAMLNDDKMVFLVDNIEIIAYVPYERIRSIPLTGKYKQCVSEAADYDGRLIPIIDIDQLFGEINGSK